MKIGPGEYGDYEVDAEFYDTVYGTVRQKDLGFFVEYPRSTPGRTLELGCGTGRVLIPTARAGCDITGLDFSPFMLEKCQAELKKQSLEAQKRARLVRGNMAGFDTGEIYALVTTPFRPFQHLISAEEQKSCLASACRHLTPEGLLILDLFNPNPLRLVENPQYTEERENFPETTLPDGRTIRRTDRTAGYHRHLQYNDIELIYYVKYPDGREERRVQQFPMRYFFRYEVEHLLSLCGFKVIDIFGDYDKTAFTHDSPELIVVARKN